MLEYNSLILDQIELLRTRLPAPSIDNLSIQEEPELKRIKRYQTHDPSLPFLFDSDGGEDNEGNVDEVDGKIDGSDGMRTEMETTSVGSLGIEPVPSKPLLGGDLDADADADEDADAEGDEEDDDRESESPDDQVYQY